MKFPQEKGVQKGVQCNLHILSKAYIKTLHNKLETLTGWAPPPPPFGVLILIWWLNTYVIFYLLDGNNFSFLSDYVFLNKKHIMFPNKTSTPRSVFHNYIHNLLKNYVSISFLYFYKKWLKANASKRFCIIHVKSIFNSKSVT